VLPALCELEVAPPEGVATTALCALKVASPEVAAAPAPAPAQKRREPLHVAEGRAAEHGPSVELSQFEDFILGVKLGCLAYVDDKPGTIENLVNCKEAIEDIAGGVEQARAPLTELLAKLGFTVDRIFSHHGILGDGEANDTQGFIAHSKHDVVLAYRGTENVWDLVTDLTAVHVPFKPMQDQALGHSAIFSCLGQTKGPDLGRVHRGFYDAFLSSIPDIQEVLLPQLQGPHPKRLVIAGHSLGGAIATGALAYLLQSIDFAALPHNVLFVTIGQPRFGNQHFRQWVDSELVRLRKLGKCCAARIVHDHDGVPLVPPERMSYEHVADLHLLTEAGDLLVSPGLRLGRAERLSEYIEDHNPTLYLQLLRSAMSKARC